MGRYRVRYSPLAIADLGRSYEWGLENWGADLVEQWFNDFEALIQKRLSAVPESFPFAPETEEFDDEVRQLIYGRYRVIFTMKRGANVALVLRVRGPFTGSGRSTDEEQTS